MPLARPRLILISGFLGAGKTTLMLESARRLRDRGLSVALITNDQDQGLVDTRFSEAQDFPTAEVAGGCFCCRFSDLMNAADTLKQIQPDVILAEPVGSCVDLSATILQPLKAHYGAEYAVAPLTVLVDPDLARRILNGEADEDVSYLFRHQLKEADVVCFTKVDQHTLLPELPGPANYRLSVVTGEGIDEWLEAMLHDGTRAVGGSLLEVDYRRYADAEAALGWVNVQGELTLAVDLSAPEVIEPLSRTIEQRLTQSNIGIAHLKLFDCCEGGFAKASVCRNGDAARVDSHPSGRAGSTHEIVVNLRAVGEPEQLLDAVQSALRDTATRVALRHAGAFRPAPPRPEHRFTEVVHASGIDSSPDVWNR